MARFSRTALATLSSVLAIACGANQEPSDSESEGALGTGPTSIHTECEVARTAFVDDQRVVLSQLSGADHCRSDPSNLLTQKLLVVAPGSPVASYFREPVDGFDITGDRTKLVVFQGTRWRILDSNATPIGPWRAGPLRPNDRMRIEDAIAQVRISPSGKRVLLKGINSGWHVFEADTANSLRVAPSPGESNDYQTRSADVAFIDDTQIVMSEAMQGPTSQLAPFDRVRMHLASLSAFDIGPLGAPPMLANVARWKVAGAMASDPERRPVQFGTVTVDPTGSYVVTGGADDNVAEDVRLGHPPLAPRPPEVRDVKTGTLVATLGSKPLPLLLVHAAAFSADGKRVALLPNPEVRVFETLTGTLVHEESTPNVMDVELSPNGKTLAERMQISLRDRGASVRFVTLP